MLFEIKNILRRFMIIFGASVIAVYIMCNIFAVATINNLMNALPIIMLITFIASLSSLIFYSKEELTKKQWWIREVICVSFVEVLFLATAITSGFADNLAACITIAVLIIAVSSINHLLEYSDDLKLAEELNSEIDKLKRK